MCPNRPEFIWNYWIAYISRLFWIQVKDLDAMASKCPYKAYLTKSTGTSFIQDEIC